MQEYNWKKEREKYRPDFMKTPEPPEQPVQASPAQASPASQRPVPPVKQKKSMAGWIAGAAVALVFAVLLVILFVRSGEPSSMLANAAGKYGKAVGLIVLTADLQDGTKIQIPVATAWAFEKNKVATNAHVAIGLRDRCEEMKQTLAHTLLERKSKEAGFDGDVDAYMKRLGQDEWNRIAGRCMEDAKKMIREFGVSILFNGTSHESRRVTHVQVHPEYGIASNSFNPDVAVLTVDGQNDVRFKVADDSTLRSLKAGEPVAFLGFPMENLKDENVNLDNPVASMQSGIVVAVTDFDLKDAGPEKNCLIRHNLPVSGGASGSPVFNRDGEVVGLLFAENTVGHIQNGQVARAPSAVMINFAVRSDLLKKMNPPVEIKEFLSR